MTNKSNNHWGSRELTPDQVARIVAVSQECRKEVDSLIKERHVKPLLTAENVEGQVNAYLEKHGEAIKDYVGNSGKIFVPMDSAEHFADMVIEKLWPDGGVTVVKHKISTYEGGESTKKQIPQEEKDIINQKLDLKPDDNILVLEDLFDTCFTAEMLTDHFTESTPSGNVKTLCLFDKEMHKNAETEEEKVEISEVRCRLGDSIDGIIKIGGTFVVGEGMDYQNRLCSRMKGLWEVVGDSSELFCGTVDPYVKRIQAIIEE